MDQVVLKTDAFRMTEEEFFQFCQQNKNLRIERNANHDIIIMSPTGAETSTNNINLYFQVESWNRQNRSGKTFNSNAGFILPNGAVRFPDVAWIPIEKWEELNRDVRKKFLPLAPDFVIELKSPSDKLKSPSDQIKILEEKMREWIMNGTKLGWLIDFDSEKTCVYRKDGSVEIVEGFDKSLSGEEVLPGFTLNLAELKSI